MEPAESTATRSIRAFFARTVYNRTNGSDMRYGYLMTSLTIVVAGTSFLIWGLEGVATLSSHALWIFVTLRTGLAYMTTAPSGQWGESFVFDDFIMILAVFVLPFDQWAAFALFTMATYCLRARCIPSVIAGLRSAIEWMMPLALGVMPFALWGSGIWAVVGGGICGLLCANVVFGLAGMNARIVNMHMPLRAALAASLDDIRDGFRETAAAEIGIGVPLAALCWTAWRYSPWAVLLVLVPYAMIWFMVRRNHAQQQVERELAEARERIGRDSLSGLFNRERFTDEAVQALVAARRSQQQVSLLMVDLDHFKSLNDTRGHQAGDKAIVGAAAALHGLCVETGVTGRYGGEEFIALACLAPVAAEELAEQLRLDIAEELAEFSTTASIGITHHAPAPAAESQSPARDYAWASQMLEQLTHQADTALYAAKRAGRNQVAIWTAESVDTAA